MLIHLLSKKVFASLSIRAKTLLPQLRETIAGLGLEGSSPGQEIKPCVRQAPAVSGEGMC
jgi:hypothetical protein